MGDNIYSLVHNIGLVNGTFFPVLLSRESFHLVTMDYFFHNVKGLLHPGCLARVVSLFAPVAAIFMVHENGDEQRQAKR